jgi:hypothetical protein
MRPLLYLSYAAERWDTVGLCRVPWKLVRTPVRGSQKAIKAPLPAASGCGAEGIRTPDLLPAEQALYQLSYSPRSDDSTSRSSGYLQATVTTCTGSEIPLSSTPRGSDAGQSPSAAANVSSVARICSPSARAPTLAAWCTPFPP